METPLFSLVVPSYNRAAWFEALRDNLLAQTEGRWEALIVDDGSDDQQSRAVAELCSADARLRFARRDREPKGAPTCRNIGIGSSNGRYLIFLDDDDLLGEPTCLEERRAAMEANPDCDFVVSPTRVFLQKPGDSDRVWNIRTPEPDLDRFLRRDIPWQTTGPTWRREAVERVGPWDESLPGRQDWEWHLRAICRGLRYRRVRGGASWWRLTRAGSVSGVLSNEAHLQATLDVLDRVGREIVAAGLMTDRRRRLLAMQHIAMGLTWCRQGRSDEADGVLQSAVERGYLPVRLLRPMQVYARAARIPLASKVVQAVLSPFVSRDYFVPWWGTQLRRPVSELANWADGK